MTTFDKNNLKNLNDHDYAPGGLMRSAKENPSVMMGLSAVGRYRRVPFWLIGVVAIVILASFVPIAWAFKARFSKSEEPRVHLFQGMDNQPAYRAQAANPMFDDGRAARMPVPGTIARGRFFENQAYELGYTGDVVAGGEVQWVEDMAETLGDEIVFDRALLDRGQELYNRFCWLCHGYDGYGNGPIHVRARKLLDGAAAGWVQPSNLHDEARLSRSDGHIYNTVTRGIRNMAGYGQSIRDPRDRWAVVAYVRALQTAGGVEADRLPPDVRPMLSEVVPPMINGEPPIVLEEEAPGDAEDVEGVVDPNVDADPAVELD
jgi:mono/diheme cytochrome c family protein